VVTAHVADVDTHTAKVDLDFVVEDEVGKSNLDHSGRGQLHFHFRGMLRR
jgi:hypothetical protein